MIKPSDKQWRATILFGQDASESAAVYGESLTALRENARAWLRDNKPAFFRNGIVTYFYSDGTFPTTGPAISEKYRFLEEGWYREDELRERHLSFSSHKIEGFEAAIVEFTENVLVPYKGPEYQDIAVVDGVLQSYLIKTVRRETDESTANELIRRGWHMISIGYAGTVDYYGREVVSRTPLYVLGHPEENAL